MTAPKPEGFTAGEWQLVPRKPTAEMLKAASQRDRHERQAWLDAGPARGDNYRHCGFEAAYEAMLGTAPINTINTAIAERDAAIARVGELEKALREIADREIGPDDDRSDFTESAIEAYNNCSRIAGRALSAAKVGGAG